MAGLLVGAGGHGDVLGADGGAFQALGGELAARAKHPRVLVLGGDGHLAALGLAGQLGAHAQDLLLAGLVGGGEERLEDGLFGLAVVGLDDPHAPPLLLVGLALQEGLLEEVALNGVDAFPLGELAGGEGLALPVVATVVVDRREDAHGVGLGELGGQAMEPDQGMAGDRRADAIADRAAHPVTRRVEQRVEQGGTAAEGQRRS
ncbi:hypothetical protein D3C72_1643410 [compost metagenome]